MYLMSEMPLYPATTIVKLEWRNVFIDDSSHANLQSILNDNR